MKLIFSSRSWSDYLFWQENDRDILRRINALIIDTRRSPFQGIGKPEPLRNEMSGWWSRRITDEHRIVYRVSGIGESQALEIASCRFHYK
ncbi:MAG TPA: Txe/YoeB family addiction module toxin [Rhizobiaceae bacterium]|nr:Txe/YoeB family addiction module toxin [Rhizobiaceae bacterium]